MLKLPEDTIVECTIRAHSSAVERSYHTREADGSNPSGLTTFFIESSFSFFFNLATPQWDSNFSFIILSISVLTMRVLFSTI